MQNRELGETPGNKAVRLSKEKRITEFFNGKDMFHVDGELDNYPAGVEREPMTNEALVAQLHNPKVARFFRPVVDEGLRLAA